jgi:hypothetical protein
MSLLFSNNATSTLQTALIVGATTVVVASGDAASFPQPEAADDYFMITVEDDTQNPALREIMKCTGRVGANLTVVRAQEGTTAQAFGTTATVANRLTAGSLNALAATAGTSAQLYLGAFATAPTATNTQGSLFAGLLYFNSTSNQMFEYSGTAWAALIAGEGTTSSGLYIGAFPNAPTTRNDGSALQSGDLYYNNSTGGTAGLYEYENGAWTAATLSTSVQGSTTVAGQLTVDGPLTVTGLTTLSDGLTVEGGLTSDNGTFTNLTVLDTLSAAGTLLLDGLPVVTQANLSGTVNSQGWPNGTQEYWGSAATDGSGHATIELPEPYMQSIDYIDVTVFSGGAGAPALNFAVPVRTTGNASSFQVYTFGTGGGLNGPVGFFWRTRGH